MRAEAEPIVRAGAGRAPLTERAPAFMRYGGQGHEIRVPLPVRAARRRPMQECSGTRPSSGL